MLLLVGVELGEDGGENAGVIGKEVEVGIARYFGALERFG